MAGFSYTKLASDFAKRTMCNLEAIDRLHSINNSRKNAFLLESMLSIEGKCLLTSKDVYEVTQLINSLFGLVILPNEKFRFKNKTNGVTEKELEIAAPNEYKELLSRINDYYKSKKCYTNYLKDKSFPVSQFINHMRCALAHSGENGLHFFPFDNNIEITHIYFYDCNYYNKEDRYNKNPPDEQFALKISIAEIRDLCKLITNLYSKVEESNKEDIDRFESRKNGKIFDSMPKIIRTIDSLLENCGD